MKLSTKTTVFRRVSFLIGAQACRLGDRTPWPPWRRLCQNPCFCRGWIGGAMAPVPPPLATPMARVMMAQRRNGQRTVRRHFNCSKRISVGILFSLCYALVKFERFCSSCKVSAIPNAKNVAGKVVKMFETRAKKTALLKSCIKEDVSSQGETKRCLVGVCETRFI